MRQLSSPQGVLVDPFGQIYVADRDNDREMRWCEGAREGTLVAGGNGQGQQANQLNSPMACPSIVKEIFMLLIIIIIAYENV